MTSTAFSYQQERPTPESGLEVVSTEYSGGLGPQLNSKNAPEHYLYPLTPESYTQSDYHPVPTDSQERQGSTEYNHQTPNKRKRKLIIIAVVVVVVVIAAVIGGILGSRAASSSNDENTEETSNNTSSPASDAAMTGTPTSVYPGLAPTAISWGYPHLEVFALTRNTTDSVYRVWRNSNATGDDDFLPGGTDMELVGGQATDARYTPSVALGRFSPGLSGSIPRNQTVLHMTDGDYTGRRQYHDDAQNWATSKGALSWNKFSGLEFQSPPTVVSYGEARRMIKTFVVGKKKNGHSGIYVYDWDGNWHSPELVHSGEPILQLWAPTVVAWSGDDSRHDVFAVSQTSSHLLHWYRGGGEDDAWSGPVDLGGFATTPPTAVSLAPGRLDVFVRGGDGGLWHRGRSGGAAADPAGERERWAAWQRLGGPTSIRGRPHAVSAGAGRADVFAWGTDGTLLRATWDEAAQRWRSGGPADGGDAGFEVMAEDALAGPPSAAADDRGNIYVFAYNDQNEIIWQTIDSNGEWKEGFKTLAVVPSSVDSLSLM